MMLGAGVVGFAASRSSVEHGSLDERNLGPQVIREHEHGIVSCRIVMCFIWGRYRQDRRASLDVGPHFLVNTHRYPD